MNATPASSSRAAAGNPASAAAPGQAAGKVDPLSAAVAAAAIASPHAHVSSSVRLGEGLGVDDLTAMEWLLSDGQGGMAMGTASGVATRRYHAWLISALTPPVGRAVLVHSAIEAIEVTGEAGTETFEYSSFRFPGDVVHPRGISYLTEFEVGHTAVWHYRLPAASGPVLVRRELALVRPGAMVVRYEVKATGAMQSLRLSVRPMLAMRDFHQLTSARRGGGSSMTVSTAPGVVSVRGAGGPEASGLEIPTVQMDLRADRGGCVFSGPSQWWYDFEYVRDRDRGQDFREDLFSPGEFSTQCTVSPGQTHATAEWRAWTGDEPGPSLEESARVHHERIDRAARHATAGLRHPLDHRAVAALVSAADQFVVRRRPAGWRSDDAGMKESATVIAGYPWFSDWGRDSAISMPGLLLSTGRYAEARSLLQGFASLMRDGLIPNCFDNGTGHAEYNTVDASLWFIHAAARYVHVTRDQQAVDAFLGQACSQIIEAYQRGTSHGIRVDPSDGLVAAGDASTQLTWMDARRDGVVFTPRAGKAVEINALWYNALHSAADMFEASRPRTTRDLRQVAERVRTSFQATFFDAYRQMCFDLAPGSSAVQGAHGGVDPAYQVRPNQIFAVSVPHSPLNAEQQQAVVRSVRQSLLTPVGLRTLSAADRDFVPRYEGSLFHRDRAYHNGTVWPWLMGPFAEAVMRVGQFSDASREEARRLLQPLIDELSIPRPGRAIGQLSEVYDAEDSPDFPRRPDGCPAQAWSVAETLRVLIMATAASAN